MGDQIVSVKIPNVPNNGGDLAKYLTTIEGEISWVPQGTTALGKDLVHALSTSNDPSTWVAFAASALQTVWQAMPAEVRNELQLVLRDLVDLGLARVQDVVSLSAQAAIGTAAEVVPLVGTIIKAVMVVINASVDYAHQVDGQNELLSGQNYWAQRYLTIAGYNTPQSMVYQQMHALNYFDYSKSGNKWHLRPCFDRSSGNADRMFLGVAGLPDSGSCGGGVLMDCPKGSFFNWDECHFHDQKDTRCTRRFGVSSLFYPFWSPAYCDTSMASFNYGYVKVGTKKYPVSDERLNPNTLMAANQYALLTSPSMNLRVDGKRLLKIRDRFRKFFLDQVKTYGGVLQITNGLAPGTTKSERLTIAPAREANYTPTQARRDKFYFDDDGLVVPYPNTGVDLNAWGVRAIRGPQTPQYAAVSLAQYNAVIGSTLAFFSARANFLRAGPLMSALLNDFGAGAFDSSVRSAMMYAAAYGKQVPRPAPARVKKLILTSVKSTNADIQRAPASSPGSDGSGGGGSGGGGAIAVAGAAAAALLYFKRK